MVPVDLGEKRCEEWVALLLSLHGARLKVCALTDLGKAEHNSKFQEKTKKRAFDEEDEPLSKAVR